MTSYVIICLALSSIIAMTSESGDFNNKSMNSVFEELPINTHNNLNITEVNRSTRLKKIHLNNAFDFKQVNFINDVVNKNLGANELSKSIVIENVKHNSLIELIVKEKLGLNVRKVPYSGEFRRWEAIRRENVIEDNKNRTMSRKRREEGDCSKFVLDKTTLQFHHPGYPGNYYSNMDCILRIEAPSQDEDYIIILDFRDKFHLEYYPNCTYDFLEIRDGDKGYDDLIGTFCGDKFPRVITSQGPNLWLRFKSDATIEYEGFTGVVTFNKSSNSKKPIKECFKDLEEAKVGVVERVSIDAKCEQFSKGRVDAVWKINVKEGWRIFLNFTQFNLAYPNECKKNFVDVFGEKTDMTDRQKNFCGSMADTVVSQSNVLHLRFFAVTDSLAKTNFSAHYTAFRNREGSTCEEDEFDCDDATCIDLSLRCDRWPNCRLKGDEDYDLCKGESESLLGKTHIVIILVIFSLILSSMSFVFVFKCVKKLVADHKIIKEHIRQSCEDRLDVIASSKLTLDPRLLQPEALPRRRDSLQRDNHRNSEMYRRQQSKPSAESEIEADTRIELDDDSWQQDIEINANEDGIYSRDNAKPKTRDKREHRSKTEERELKAKESKRRETVDRRETTDKRGTLDRRETETSEKRGPIERKRTIDKKDIIDRERRQEDDFGTRNVSVGTPDTKESGCQTRESLFQTGTAASSDGTESVSGVRGFSTFGYSGSTLMTSRRATPPPASPPALTIEIVKACQQPESKKGLDRRPMSTETTRSAPDVIIVSKPIR